jgi:hypothetical protein
MQVVTFDRHAYNYIFGERNEYFTLTISDGRTLLLGARCPHRGGPWHLAAYDGAAKQLICPWHQVPYSDQVLQRQSLPLVVRGGIATAVLDEPAESLRLANRAVLTAMRREEEKPCCN